MKTISQSRSGWYTTPATAVLLLALLTGTETLTAQQAPQAAAQRVIRVMGTGEVRTIPDQAHLDLSVETFAATARAAGEENARTMDRVIRALTGAGVPRAQIQTRGYLLFPEYAQPDRPPVPRVEGATEGPRIIGYRARNTVSVRTQDLARVGSLIDTALGAGANRFDGLRFSIQDAEAVQNQAIRQASERARRTAEAMAAALGVRLGAIVEASTVADPIRPMMQFERAAMADIGPTPIEPGEEAVSATVTVVFAIEGG
jgi:uncharacterized protein